MLSEDNLKLAEDCFRDARITDDLSPSSIEKYTSSLKKLLAFIAHKKLESLSNEDFDPFYHSHERAGSK